MFKEISLGGVSLAALAYAGVSVVYLGPTVGERMGRADHLAYCKTHHVEWVKEQSAAELSKLEEPKTEYGAGQVRQMLNSPLMRMAQGMSRYGLRPGQPNPLGQVLGMNPFEATSGYADALDQKAREARAAYNAVVSEIKSRANAQLSKSDDLCSQAITKAVGASPYEWGAFAGSGGLIELGPVKNFRHEIKVALRAIRAD